MKFQRINRADPEKVFVVVKNAYSTAALTSGQVVQWAYNATDDGLAVSRPTSTKRDLVAGVVEGTVAIGGYGEIQCYGHNANCLVSGGTDVAVGDKLVTKTGVFNLIKANTTNSAVPSILGIVAGQAFTTSTAAAKKVFLKCM